MARCDPSTISIRTTIKPGDLGAIVQMHGKIYADEYGFDETFEAYVAGPMAEFVCRNAGATGGLPASAAQKRERLWIVEKQDRIVGCVAIVAAFDDEAQLRWFLVDPSARGRGLGRKLINEAISFAKSCGYRSTVLWTVDSLTIAAHLYTFVGFRLVEQQPARQWGVDVLEQKYEMML